MEPRQVPRVPLYQHSIGVRTGGAREDIHLVCAFCANYTSASGFTLGLASHLAVASADDYSRRVVLAVVAGLNCSIIPPSFITQDRSGELPSLRNQSCEWSDPLKYTILKHSRRNDKAKCWLHAACRCCTLDTRGWLTEWANPMSSSR
jgi:hypothetical protein